MGQLGGPTPPQLSIIDNLRIRHPHVAVPQAVLLHHRPYGRQEHSQDGGRGLVEGLQAAMLDHNELTCDLGQLHTGSGRTSTRMD